MKKRPEEPFVPPERGETIRQEIIALLDGRSLSAREISSEVGIAIREVYEHLAHVRKTVSRTEQKLAVKPAECKGCGFVFRKRERLNRPGRCPVCRGESIQEPLFSLAAIKTR